VQNVTLLRSQNPQEKIRTMEQLTMKMSISMQTALHPNSSIAGALANNFKEGNMKRVSSTLVFQTLTCQDLRAILHSIWNALISQKTLSLPRIRGRQELVKPNPL
jgi:hypothetical protein